MNDSHQQYTQRQQRLQQQMKETDSVVTLGKKTSNLFRQTKQARQTVDVRDFNHVLDINPDELWVEAEGMTTYEALVDALEPHALVPTVAPELKSVTIGGATAGIGIESSSFKYGFVHETVQEMDVLLSSGEVVTCSPQQHADLFFAIPNSYGTLGYVLRVKQSVVAAQPYVEITRQRFTEYESYVAAMASHAREARTTGTYDYIDGLVFSPDEMYLMLGRFVETAPFVSDYTYMKSYYKSMDKERDYLTAKDYLFRYDTDWFWAARSIGLENPILRFLWGRKRLRSDVYYRLFGWGNKHRWIQRLQAQVRGHETETLIQDAEIPVDQAAGFLSWFHTHITTKRPLTIGPVMAHSSSAHYPLFPMDPNTMYMNVGYYAGVPSTKEPDYYNHLFDQKLLELGAKKMMYSKSTFSEEEFWQMFDREAYQKVKTTYDSAGKLPNLYQRTVQGW